MGTTPTHTVYTEQPSLPADTDTLIQEYAPLVKYVAQRLACRLPASVCLDDLISAGALGLMDAIAKYDPTRGTTFKTYAEWRMRGAMLDELRDWEWAPRSVREKELAAFLGLDLATFADWLSDVRGVSVLSLDMPLELEPNGNTGTALARLVDETPGPLQQAEAQDLTRHLAEAIDQLPAREKTVLSLYYYEELTMQEIGQVLELTLSRISQIHTKAILHLRAAMQTLTQGASLNL